MVDDKKSIDAYGNQKTAILPIAAVLLLVLLTQYISRKPLSEGTLNERRSPPEEEGKKGSKRACHMRSRTNPESEALIVGAGPTGMVLASEFQRHGMQCRIIDRLSQPSQTSKALGIQARTLELFEKMGVVESFLDKGVNAPATSGMSACLTPCWL